jgi:hypothetical protein
MDNQNWDVLDPPRSKLRALAAKLQEQISLLDSALQGGSAPAQFVSVADAWRELSGALDLGAEPALRSCPSCQRRVPVEATRCRYCMATSPAAAKEHAP